MITYQCDRCDKIVPNADYLHYLFLKEICEECWSLWYKPPEDLQEEFDRFIEVPHGFSQES